jgi:hypothetical protein
MTRYSWRPPGLRFGVLLPVDEPLHPTAAAHVRPEILSDKATESLHATILVVVSVVVELLQLLALQALAVQPGRVDIRARAILDTYGVRGARHQENVFGCTWLHYEAGHLAFVVAADARPAAV